jgi:GNAT superfamily N-acetyltransferase
MRAAGVEFVQLGRDHAREIAAFTRIACEFDPLSLRAVERAIFDDPASQLVCGVYDGGLEGVGVAVVRDGTGYVKLLAVHPRARRRGLGSALLGSAVGFCRDHGAAVVLAGVCAPWYVVPGVDVRATEAVCMLEADGWEHCGEAVNMSVALRGLPEPQLPIRTAEDVPSWVAEQYPQWLAEVSLAVTSGTCIAAGDDGFACYDVLREGWLGPMATRIDGQRRGIGTATLLGALHAMRERGYERADIAWVGPVAFYTRTVGARISRVFWWYRKPL